MPGQVMGDHLTVSMTISAAPWIRSQLGLHDLRSPPMENAMFQKPIIAVQPTITDTNGLSAVLRARLT